MTDPIATAPRPALSGSEAAAAARRERAAVKREVAFSGEALRRVVARCGQPDGRHLRRMRVVDLLAAMPGLGKRRAEDLASGAGIDATRRLGGLGTAQVDRLAAMIDNRAERRLARRE